MNKAYYTLKLRLRPGWQLPQAMTLKIEGGDLKGVNSSQLADPGVWKDPPHVAFANLGYDALRGSGVASDAEVEMFTSRYGPLTVLQGKGAAAQLSRPTTTDEVIRVLFVSTQTAEPFWQSLQNFRLLQGLLRSAWTQKNARLFTDSTPSGDRRDYGLLAVTWELKGNQLEMRPAGCDDYMGILLTRDVAEKRARVCQNPRCPAPYFVAGRRDAKFCSHKCAVAVGVKNFRKRQRRKK